MTARRGLSDNMTAHSTYKDLYSLKQQLKEMVAVRNGDRYYTRETCTSHVGTQCSQHYVTTQEANNAAISVTELNNVASRLSYCNCDSRHAPGCVCREYSGTDYCQCHSRTVLQCNCQVRSGGKYSTWNQFCACYVRAIEYCSCRARNATISCTCDSRCSCNSQKTFSMIDESSNKNCLCNTKTVSGCICDTNYIHPCTSHSCTCHGRTAPGCSCHAVNEFSHNTALLDPCVQNVNDNPTESIFYPSCTCRSRCGCDQMKILPGQTSVSYVVESETITYPPNAAPVVSRTASTVVKSVDEVMRE